MLMAGAMGVLWRTIPDERACPYWLVGAVLAAPGLLLISLRGAVPGFLTFPVANAMIVGGYGITVIGVGEFTGRRIPFWPIAVMTAGIFVFFCYFLFVDSDLSLRVLVSSVLVGGMAYWAAQRLITEVPPGMRLTQGLTATIFLLNGTALFGRAVVTLLEPASMYDVFVPSTAQAVVFVILIVSSIGLTFGFAAMATRRLHLHLDHLASHDPLTLLLNRQAVEKAAARETARARRHGYPLAMLMMDIDRFKQVNDTFGHEAGDAVLKSFAKTAQAALRRDDELSRYGGEEFLALLPDSDRASALNVAERIRAAIADTPIVYEGKAINVTVSIGAAVVDESGSWEAAVRAADNTLYEAKRTGRNRVAG